MKTYSELKKLDTFEDRFNYLKMTGKIVGEETFRSNRYLNQAFYKSDEWLSKTRPAVIIRDQGCDLGCLDREIPGNIIVHHMNSITVDDILEKNPDIFNPEYLITCSHSTHQALHYGTLESLITNPIERFKNDTAPWLRKTEDILPMDHEKLKPIEKVETKRAPVPGSVSNCDKLNIRKLPSMKSEVLTILDSKSEILVNPDELKFDELNDVYFYKVTTASGIEGYCVTDFIEF